MILISRDLCGDGCQVVVEGSRHRRTEATLLETVSKVV